MLGMVVFAWAVGMTLAFSRLVNQHRHTEHATRSLGLVDQMLRSGRSYRIVGAPGTHVVIGHGVELGGVRTLRAETFELRRDDGATLRITRGAAIQLIAVGALRDGDAFSLAAGTELLTRYLPSDGS
ncbi:MAG: hypothetical protein H0T79_00020, partial [Deltaproteobacteria bacterium]|nr:hypothetical protein [Deltaproteobacteria bacterium]